MGVSAAGDCAGRPASRTEPEQGCRYAKGSAVIDWVHFVMLGGITYIADNPAPGRSIRGSDLGEPYGEVTCELSGNVTAPGYELRNGDSAYLRPGTTIRRVRGYTPEFRVAARYRGKLTLYEADTNPDATLGSHLLDIRGKVDYVRINSVKDGTTEIASIKRRTEVSRLVHLLLEASVDQDHATYSDADYEDQAFISFHLDDGTAVTRALYQLSGELLAGFSCPMNSRMPSSGLCM